MGRTRLDRYTSSGDVKDILKNTRKQYRANMAAAINKLASMGYEAITLAWSQRGPKDRTYNLYDSYASAVYLKGQLLPHTIRYVQGERSTEPDRFNKTGRDYIKEFFDKPDIDVKSKDITIVCVAAVPYAEALEKGTYNVAPRRFVEELGEFRAVGKAKIEGGRPLGRKYQVIRIAQGWLGRNKTEINQICKGLFKGTAFQGVVGAASAKRFKTLEG